MFKFNIAHNLFYESIEKFAQSDPHLYFLASQPYQHNGNWWQEMNLAEPGVYILTGGRQVGKSTSCKQLILHCLEKNFFSPEQIFYLPCDEIFLVTELAFTLRNFLSTLDDSPFLLIVDEITFVKDWDRLIKALADEGIFRQGVCILTGSDTIVLKEASMCFPGRRGNAAKTDFHLYPLTFHEYVNLISDEKETSASLRDHFMNYLQCGGYLRAINDMANHGTVLEATYSTYEQWILGDFIKQGKNEKYLQAVLHALFTVGSSQISYSSLTQKIGLLSKETCIDYCRLLERMDVLIDLQAYDQNKKQGFPKKARKFHFFDPFIQQTIYRWLQRKGYLNHESFESIMVEAIVAGHCYRTGKVFYFKGQGEIDVIWLKAKEPIALEVKWTSQLRPMDLKNLKQFSHSTILTKSLSSGKMESIPSMPIYQFLYEISS